MLFWLGDFGPQLGDFGPHFPKCSYYADIVVWCMKIINNVIKNVSLRSHQLLKNIRFKLFRYFICSLVESVRA